jgi:DNA-binding protein HU-beta
MNKSELIESIGGRLGDKKAATAALDAVLAEIQSAVTKGDKVSITGFGVFERRERAARMARNPRTGATVKVKKTAVPVFRPGTGFKELVAVGRAPKATAAAASATKRATKKIAAKAAPARKATAAKTAPARKATAAKTASKARTAPTPAKRSTVSPAARRPAMPTKARASRAGR